MAIGTKTAEALRDAVAPALAALGVELYDVEILSAGAGGPGRTIRIVIDREGGIDLDGIAAASQSASAILDNSDVVSGPYELEVSSPGVERPLRRPEHFRSALGKTVSVKHRTPDGARRVRGVLVDAGDDSCTVEADDEAHEIEYHDVTAAHTVFEWGPAPRPGGAKPRGATTKERPKENARS